jgi:phospholipid transport system substrate-binding protein
MVRTAVALVVVLFALSQAWAGMTPTEFLQQVFAKANGILTDPESADRPLERLLAVRKLVNEAFDFRSAAELASGDHWLARTTAEQEEFTWLFSDLLERGFVSRMASKASLTGGAKIRYLDESIEGSTALVQTAMARRNGGELLLDYHLIERDGAWKIRDVAIDGVSLMANYRAQLDRVLGNASFPELLSQMRAKVGVLDQPEHPASVRLTTVVVSPPAPPVAVAIAPTAPPPPAVKPPPPTLRTRMTRAYWLRMMTAGTAEEAGRLVSRLREGKFPIAVDRTNGRGKLVVNVRVGPFRDAEQAVLNLLDLQRKGHNPYLVAERD